MTEKGGLASGFLLVPIICIKSDDQCRPHFAVVLVLRRVIGPCEKEG